MQNLFSRKFGFGRSDRNRKAVSRRLAPGVDGLETRNLLTGGSVTLSGAVVTVLPAPAGPNTVVVQHQTVGSTTELDVQLNGVDHDFALSSVSMVFFNGSGAVGAETFTNNTSLSTVDSGGSGTNNFTGGSGMDEFIGGSGTNNFTGGTGYEILIGGTGTNNYNENANGSGLIIEAGASNNVDAGGNYLVY